MANVVINGDTSGTVTLSAPAVAGNTQISLPVNASGIMLLEKASSLTANGFITLSNQLTLQWGRVASLALNDTTVHNLPTTFSTAAVAAFAIIDENNTTDQFDVKATANTSRITLTNTNNTAFPVYFIVIGY